LRGRARAAPSLGGPVDCRLKQKRRQARQRAVASLDLAPRAGRRRRPRDRRLRDRITAPGGGGSHRPRCKTQFFAPKGGQHPQRPGEEAIFLSWPAAFGRATIEIDLALSNLRSATPTIATSLAAMCALARTLTRDAFRTPPRVRARRNRATDRLRRPPHRRSVPGRHRGPWRRAGQRSGSD
jgi:hypothetical protein